MIDWGRPDWGDSMTHSVTHEASYIDAEPYTGEDY